MLSFLGLFDRNVLSLTVEKLVQSFYREFFCKDGVLTSDENHCDYFVQNYHQRWLTMVAPRQVSINF
jgi:hypothetical protein